MTIQSGTRYRVSRYFAASDVENVNQGPLTAGVQLLSGTVVVQVCANSTSLAITKHGMERSVRGVEVVLLGYVVPG